MVVFIDGIEMSFLKPDSNIVRNYYTKILTFDRTLFDRFVIFIDLKIQYAKS